IDGLRVDAVASMLYLDYSRPEGGWTPNIYGGRENLEAVQFLQEMNATVHKAAPGIVTVAEESTSWPGVTRATNLGGLAFSIQRMMQDMNGIYRSRRALWSQDSRPEGYSWIDANDSANNVLSFLRFGDDGSMLACVFNFSGSEHTRYRLGLPHAGTWREVLNTDADIYNGSGIGNYGAVEATEEPWHGRPASTVMVLPPLAALWFEPA